MTTRLTHRLAIASWLTAARALDSSRARAPKTRRALLGGASALASALAPAHARAEGLEDRNRGLNDGTLRRGVWGHSNTAATISRRRVAATRIRRVAATPRLTWISRRRPVLYVYTHGSRRCAHPNRFLLYDGPTTAAGSKRGKPAQGRSEMERVGRMCKGRQRWQRVHLHSAQATIRRLFEIRNQCRRRRGGLRRARLSVKKERPLGGGLSP